MVAQHSQLLLSTLAHPHVCSTTSPQLLILHRTLLFFVYNRVILQFCYDSVQFLMTKNSQECLEVNPVSRDVTLSCSLTRGFPARCLLCLVKEAIYPTTPNPRIKETLNPPKEKKKKKNPNPASVTSLTIPSEQRNVNIPEANYWVQHVRGDQVPTLSA